jgi:acyl-CoA carboxylase subunit beta
VLGSHAGDAHRHSRRGAALSKEAEESGLAAEIARCLQDLVMLQASTLAVLGQGTGGGALALVPADRGAGRGEPLARAAATGGRAAAIVTGTSITPARWRGSRGSATDLWRAGTVDRVPERPDAADERLESTTESGWRPPRSTRR